MGRKPCCTKEDGLNKGAWTAMEDTILVDYIKVHGEGKWRSIPKEAGLKRCGKSCRLRWLNYLRPDIKRGNITRDEEDLIIRLHKLLGNRWSLIAGRLPGRTDNEIKNYWNTVLSKRVRVKVKEPCHNSDKDIVSSGVVFHAKARLCTKVFLTPQLQQLTNGKHGKDDIVVGTVPAIATAAAELLMHETAVESDSSDGSFTSLYSKQDTPSKSNVAMGFDGINTEADFASEFYKQLMDFDFCDMNTAGIYDCGETPLLKEEMVTENWSSNDCVEANNWDSDFGYLSSFLESSTEDFMII